MAEVLGLYLQVYEKKGEKSIANFKNKLRFLANEIYWNILQIFKTLFHNFSPISFKKSFNFQNKEIYHIKNLEIMKYNMQKILNQDNSYTQRVLNRCKEFNYLKIHSPCLKKFNCNGE